MAFDPELMKQLIITFKTELEEQCVVITEGLLKLEKDMSDESRLSIISTLFRAAHNIKGSSRSLGIMEVGEIAHGIESIFTAIQNKTLAITPTVTDLCLLSVDKLRTSLMAFIDKKPLDFNLKELLSNLQSCLNNGSPPPKVTTTDTVADKTAPINNQQKMENIGADSVRVSINNIDRISALMEEMQANKIAIDEYFNEFIKIDDRLKIFTDNIKKFSIGANTLGKEFNDQLNKQYFNDETMLKSIKSTTHFLKNNIKNTIGEFSILSNSLQEEIRMLRLVPVANLLGNMPRYIRELSREMNKKVDLTIVGDEVKMDKMVLEILKDPIIHILRNSVDHGIEDAAQRTSAKKPETGLINITIREESGKIKISITDDGAGIDTKKIKQVALNKKLFSENELNTMSETNILDIIFTPGFSTREIISNISGRGVGLDVVKVNIAKINGTIDIENSPGKGTQFVIVVPLTLASERGLMIKNAAQSFAIPTSYVQRVVTLPVDEVKEIEGAQAIMLDHHPIPLHSLSSLLGMDDAKPHTQDRLSVIVIKKGAHSAAIMVDEIINEKEIVIKSFSRPLEKIPCVAGGTLSANNQVVIVLDASDLIDRATHGRHVNHIAFNNTTDEAVSAIHVLVVDDSITTRTLEKNILETKNYKVTVAVNGKEAWDLLQKNKYALLITDVMMPIMDGFSLTELVKKDDVLRNMPVIIVTSLNSDEEKKRGIEVGADAYIVKNEFESGALLSIVEQLV